METQVRQLSKLWLYFLVSWATLYLYIVVFKAKISMNNHSFGDEHYGMPASVMNLITVLCMLVAILGFFRSVAVLTRNHRHMYQNNAWPGSRWVMFGYILPPINLFLPMLHMIKIVECACPSNAKYVYIWWTMFLSSLFCVTIGVAILTALAGTRNAQELTFLPVVDVLGACLFFVSTIAYCIVANATSHAQQMAIANGPTYG